MNILFTEMEYHNLQWQVKLVEDGHTVYTTQTGSPNYLKTLNINSISDIEYRTFTNPDNYTELNNNLPPTHLDKLEQVIEKYKIDLIINTWPTFNSIIHKKDFGIDIISANETSIKLETEKQFGKMFAEKCGIKVPKTLQTGEDHMELNEESLPNKFILKPSNFWNSSIVIQDKKLLEYLPIRDIVGSPVKMKYFCEEYIKGYETNISYIMSEGKWSFTFSEHCSEEKSKQINGEGPTAWFTDTIIEELTPEIDKQVRDNVVEYLNQAGKLGGTYEGSITQMLGEDGELYFLENNCRPYVQNTFPLPLGGNEYLDAFRNNPQKIGDCFVDKKFPKLVLQNGKEYPVHLHEKYGLPHPTNIEIIEDKYIVNPHNFSANGVVVVFEDEINMDFVNEVEKESDFKAYWGD